MSSKADGTVYINTEIDTSGIDKGMKSLGKSTQSIGQTGEKVGEEFSKGVKEGMGEPLTEPLENQMQIMQNKLGALSSSMTKFGGTMSLVVTAPLMALSGKMITAASDMEESLNKVDVAFGESADYVKEWADTATESFGLSKNQALEATSLFGDMSTSMGLSQEEASNMSTTLAGLAGDLASFKNIDIEQAMTALNGIFTGETESLKMLGVVMTETNLQEFADKIGVVYDEMSQAEKVQLRYAYVMEMTKNAQGDYARTSDGTANSLRTFSATLENLTATLGEVLLPIITPIIQSITKLIEKFGEMDPASQKIIVDIGLVAAAIGPLAVALGGLVSGISTIISVASALGTVFLPVVAIIAAITAAIGATIGVVATLWNQNEGFRESVIATWERIKEAFSSFMDGLLERINSLGFDFESMTEVLTTAWNALCEFLAPVIEEAFNNIAMILETVFSVLLGLFDVFAGIFTGDWSRVWEGIKTIFSSVFETMKNIGSTIMDALFVVISTIGNKIKENFLNTFESIKTGISWIWDKIVEKVKNSINGIITIINFMIESVVKGINTVIDILNGLEIEVPDWVPVLGGKEFSLGIPSVTAPKIPYLATGAVIPPNAPFMAVLGDQKHGTNIEAPLSTIENALDNVLNRRGGASGNMTLHNVMQLNRRVLYDEFIEEAKLRMSATGRNPFDLA